MPKCRFWDEECIHGDCLDVMATMETNCIDSIVTDPPYGLKFMGKDWDHGIPGAHFWAEAIRVAKPGAHLLAFGGTRTFHRLACAIEDAGWEIRDCLGWIYGSGFPKSHNLKGDNAGWGTALKPAWEPIILARKPLEGTVAQNVQKWGTGAINVDGCRVGTNPGYTYPNGPKGNGFHGGVGRRPDGSRQVAVNSTKSRWPANLLHDGSEEVLELFPETKSGAMLRPYKYTNTGNSLGNPTGETKQIHGPDSGSAARFFYCAKASRKEREAGLDSNPKMRSGSYGDFAGDGRGRQTEHRPASNHHPTVKPLSLMRYLCRLISPPGAVILDPFMGSGTTGMAAKAEGFRFIGIEQALEYCEIAKRRIEESAHE